VCFSVCGYLIKYKISCPLNSFRESFYGRYAAVGLPIFIFFSFSVVSNTPKDMMVDQKFMVEATVAPFILGL
jgi:hypothetical protein